MEMSPMDYKPQLDDNEFYMDDNAFELADKLWKRWIRDKNITNDMLSDFRFWENYSSFLDEVIGLKSKEKYGLATFYFDIVDHKKLTSFLLKC